MKKIYTYLREISLIIALLVLATAAGWGQDGYDPETGKEIVGPDIPRTALVGPYCMVNQFSSAVEAIKTFSDLDNVTDENLNNYATITCAVRTGTGVTPVFSVKDTKHVYEKGTTAGFSLVSGGGVSLLSLDIIKMFSIAFYKDGKQQGDPIPVTTGQDAGGVGLNLVKIPGSDAVSVDVSVVSTSDFDEIYLMENGISVEAISQFSVKYAFVGTDDTYYLTHSGVKEYGETIGISDFGIELNDCKGWPWPVTGLLRDDTLEDRFFDDDHDNELTTGGISILGIPWFDVSVKLNNKLEIGTEIGFKYSIETAMSLSLLGSMSIEFYMKGKKVQTEIIEMSLLGLGVVVAKEEIVSATAMYDFDEVRFIYSPGIADINIGKIALIDGFIRKKPQVYHHCEINPNIDATICSQKSSFQLKSEIPVQWFLLSAETYEGEEITTTDIKIERATPNDDTIWNVTNLLEDGCYTFVATANNCPNNPACTEVITLNKGIVSNEALSTCGIPLQNEDGEEQKYALSNGNQISGALLSISDIKNPENLIDAKDDNYMSYVSGLSIANNLEIVGIKTTDGSLIGNDIDGTKRVGFIVEDKNTLLDVDLLQYMCIRLYKNGQEIKDDRIPKVIDESNTIGVGLIESEKSQKVRYSIAVPADIEFDEFRLWVSGVLNLGLNTLRIYYGFVESADANCSNPLNAGCALSASTETTNASLSIDLPVQTAGIATALTGADCFIDNDMETALQYTTPINVLTKLVFKVKIGRTIDDTQQLVIVMDNKTYLAGINAGQMIKVETYYKGIQTGDVFENWSTLGLNVIGYGDKKYLIVNTNHSYDEVHITYVGLADLLTTYSFYGIFFRSDIDRDGLPDCIDPDSCEGELSSLNITPENICVGDKVVLSGLANFDNLVTLPKDYYISIKDKESAEQQDANLTINANGVFEFPITMDKAGIYEVTVTEKEPINEGEDVATYYGGAFKVHPTRTTWKTLETTTTDWNEWTNWSEGSPWTCTDVIIPSDANTYPVLESGVMNGCRYIHFEPNAEVVNTHRLTYEKAWVELALHPNRYYMVTVPLKDTYSGDWFWNDLNNVDYFTALNDETLPEKRVTPTIYQRVWDFPVTDVINSNGTQTQVKSTQWSLPYNYLATKYETNSGGYNFNAVSVWVHPSTPANNEEGDGNGVYKFRFPKEHTLYYYYDKNGSSVGLSESIKRNKAQAGRFIYESEDSTVTFPYVMRFTNDQMQSGEHDVFFVGNPFMSHIDVNRFYEVNPHLTDILVGADNQYKHLEYKEASTGVIATSDVIAPMQSFLVRQEGDAPSCTITFTEDMLVSAPKIKLTSSPEEAPTIEENTISITASASDTRSSALIRFSASASDNYREREDAEILIENETPPAVAIFTTAEDRALDIQQRANGGEIPLGMYLPKPEDVTLRIAVPDEYSGWMVEDVETNRRYPLMPGEETEIHVGRLTTNVGRFYLKGQSATGNETITATQPKLYCYREAGSHTLVVRSGSEMMTRCEVYGMDGRLRHIGQFETDEYRFSAQKGVQIVKVYFKDGITSTVKVF